MKKSIIVSTITTVVVMMLMSFLFPNTLNLSKEYYAMGGVIRNEGKGWNVIDDSGHEPIGITKVETTNESVIVYYAKADKVVSVNVTPDETMALEGYTMGASVGLDKTIISIYDKEHSLINPNDYKNGKGNIWINGTFKK